MIFVSTGGVRDRSGADIAESFHQHGITAVELSGGLSSATMEIDLGRLANEMILQPHNYFPPPPSPFVFNLASPDPAVVSRSMQHVRNAMRLCVTLGRSIYSFHAGFRIDPVARDLGRPMPRSVVADRHAALRRFRDNVLVLAEEADLAGIGLMIENNVLTSANLAAFGEDPLLFTHVDEIVAFMKTMPSNVGLLLDVAHLKVTARTLGFDPRAAHDRVAQWIRAYHLSDNDGMTDSNQPVTPESWFWDAIQPDLDYYSLEVYGVSPRELARQRDYVQRRLADRTLSPR